MSDLITQPETGSLSAVYAPGVMDSYSTAELDQIGKLQEAAVTVSSAEQNYRYEVIKLKLMLDGEDRTNGGLHGADRGGSRFWDGARAGHFGDRLQESAENGNRATVHRWVQANNAAAILLGSTVTDVTMGLPLQAAKALGINPSTLEIYALLNPDAREVADFYYETRGELKADMLKKIRLVCSDFSDRKPELLKGLVDNTIKYPSHIDDLTEGWVKELEIQKALREEQERQDKLQEAEKFEEEVDKQPPPEKTSNINSSQEDVTRRKAPKPSWFKSDSGVMKTKNVVGDLPKPLADAVNGLSGLKKQLYIQRDHSSEMHDYAEFWAGYDRHAMSEAAAQRVWGQAGRLGRMEKLRKLMIEVNQMLDVYIKNTTPPENIEYPED
jgi:hypothetical protein